MTILSEDFRVIIDNFSKADQNSVSDLFIHEIRCRNSNLVKVNDSVKPERYYSDSYISKGDFGVLLSCGNSYSEYTNYEKFSIKSKPKQIRNSVEYFEFTYIINSVDYSEANRTAVSYDDFEKIDPNYNPDVLAFNLMLSDANKISVHLNKAPCFKKINQPESFNHSIRNDSSFWEYRYSSVNDVCNSDLIGSGDRIVSVRTTQGSIVTELATGDFSPVTLTSLGRDGRFCLKSEITEAIANAGIEIIQDSEGFIHNELKYPLKTQNSVISIIQVNEENKLNIKFEVILDYEINCSFVNVIIFDDLNTLTMKSNPIIMPMIDKDKVAVSLELSSKTNTPDLNVSNIVMYSSELTDIPDNSFGVFKSPINYMRVTTGASSYYLNSNLDNVSLPLDSVLTFGARLPIGSGSITNIWTSLNQSSYINDNESSLIGLLKYGTHEFKSYVEGSNGIESSSVTRTIITVNPSLTTPTFSASTATGDLIISATSEFDILYSTDGDAPDLKNRTNVALYTKPFKINKKTIIKAVSVYDNIYSEVTQFIFDPDTLFLTQSILPNVNISGTNSPEGYISPVTVTFSDFTGTVYYTLDGSDPLDHNNPERVVYIDPFVVLPVGSRKIVIHVGVVEDGKRRISTYN